LSKETNNTLQAFWVGMGSLSSFGLSIVSAVVLSRYFGKTEYGTYRQVLYVYNTLLIIFSAGLPKVYSYYLPRFDLSQGKDIVWKVTKVLIAGGFCFSVFLFLCSDIISEILKNPDLSVGLKWFSPIPILLLPTLGIEGIFSTYKKTIYIALYNTISRFLMLVSIVLPVVVFEGTYIHAIYGWIFASFLSLIIALYFKQIPFKSVLSKKSNLMYSEVLKYSMPLVTASIAGIAIRSADQFYISRYFGSAVFAEFSNGFIELPFVLIITGATSTVLMPIFSEIDKNKSDISQVITLFRSAILKSSILIYPIVMFFIFNAENVILTLYSSTYLNSTNYFRIALTLNFFNIIIFAPLLLAMGKTHIYSKVHILFAFAVWILGYLVVYIFKSPVAIALLSVGLSILKILVFSKIAANILGIRTLELIPFKKITIIIIHSFLVVNFARLCIGHMLPHSHYIFSLGINFSIFLLLTLLTAKYFTLNYSWVWKAIHRKERTDL
jgi:O-antigen/teichoic acid export membrane protein